MSADVLEENFQNLNINVRPEGIHNNNKFKRPKRDSDINLTEILNDIGIVGKINADKIRILSQKDVIRLFFNDHEEMVVNSKDMKMILSFNVDQMERIFCNDAHVDALKNNFQLFLNLITHHSVESLLSILETTGHGELNEYSMKNVLQRYDEDTRHLVFMADDPTLVLYLNYDNIDMVGFGLYNYNINVEWVRAALVEDHAGDRGALLEFDRILRELNYYVGDESPDEFEYEEIDF